MRTCAWCPALLDDGALVYCSKRCRQAAYRARHNARLNLGQAERRALRALALEGFARRGLRLAYADPPYPGKAWLYRDEPSYGGEVDHAALVERLQGFDGWALSTSAEALRVVLPLCPSSAFVCAWGKPKGVSRHTRGKHNTWEPLIVVPARRFKPGVPDFLATSVARGEGQTLIGRKPQRFCTWMFRLLGALPGDELADLYPGTGIVGATFASYCASLAAAGRDAASLGAGRRDEPSPMEERRDASLRASQRDARRAG